eukprot:TRINITY_DN8788_c0_g1_i1.p1 TRINITY_DN8788_c0_g1~~TRINITY_DN8788_c0_g1_i1.p1  ORF type:complete len:459 (-),score=78.76 TRINITY_DN8788_c0_g1_i1:14-1390(-)
MKPIELPPPAISPFDPKEHYAQPDLDEQYVNDISYSWLYKPRTITLGLILVLVIGYFAFFVITDETSTVTNMKTAFLVIAIFIMLLGSLVFPAGPFVRPHPVIWRLAFGVGVIYELFLIIILFQNKRDARLFMTYLDNTLKNQPVEYREYAAHCELTWENVWPTVWDPFMLAHFFGYLVKALIFRHWLICWALSITWEIIEIAFLHMLPNFAECWWDQVFLDVLICNALGIYVGRKLCDYFEMKQYIWISVKDERSWWGKTKRFLQQFTPADWIHVRWHVTSSMKRFLAVHFVVLVVHLGDLNSFFLKHLLWVYPASNLNVFRLIFWVCFLPPAFRQLYLYITDSNCKRMGLHCFLTFVILATELLIIFKLGRGEFATFIPTPFAQKVLLVSGCVYVAIIVGVLLYVTFFSKRVVLNTPSLTSSTPNLVDGPSSPMPTPVRTLVRAHVLEQHDRNHSD